MKKNAFDPMFIISDFRFEDTTPEELEKLRKSGTAGLVLKIDGKLYYAKISKDLNLSSANYLGNHMCAHGNVTCRRLSAASDEQGGCAKVRDGACGIERYDWIVRGYETFGTKHDVFIVAQCDHFEKCPPHQKKMTFAEKKRIHDGLLDFLYDTRPSYNWWGNVIPRKNKKSYSRTSIAIEDNR